MSCGSPEAVTELVEFVDQKRIEGFPYDVVWSLEFAYYLGGEELPPLENSGLN